MSPRVKLPFGSQSATKSYGKILTFYDRGGEQKVRIYNKPSGLGSEAQLAQRQIIKDKVAAWQALSPGEKATWNVQAKALGDPWSGYTLFMREYVPTPPPTGINPGDCEYGIFWHFGIINPGDCEFGIFHFIGG